MKRTPTLLTIAALMACRAPVFSAAAQTVSHTSVKPKSAQGQKAPMRHDQLTLYPHGKPARRQSAYGYTRHRFDQPTPIHNTFMGVQRW
jgi:Spy/CpxP family protein refolding chaperone